jgi:hypothetical protein
VCYREEASDNDLTGPHHERTSLPPRRLRPGHSTGTAAPHPVQRPGRERVAASLLEHRELWTAALLDRPGAPDYREPGGLLIAGLIKLRDLPDDLWNADTLFVLTPTREKARQLVRIAEEEDWGGEARGYEDQQEMDRALGTGRQEYGLLSVWWD